MAALLLEASPSANQENLQQIYVSAECDFYLLLHSLYALQGGRWALADGVTEVRVSECKSLTRGCLCRLSSKIAVMMTIKTDADDVLEMQA